MNVGRLTRTGAVVAASLVGLVASVGGGIAHATDAPAVPADVRLAPVRPALESIVARAASEGLPADLIVGKVREGLAKGVPPEAIRAAAERLAGNLEVAARFIKTTRPAPVSAATAASSSSGLIRVIADAQMAGVEPAAMAPLVVSNASDLVVARAIEVVIDLTMRGYPSRRAGAVLREITDRDAAALGRVVAGVEAIRAEQTVSRADALEVLGRTLQTSGTSSLDAAVARALEGGDRAGNGSGSAPGKSGDAPGHTGSTGASKVKKPKK